MQHLYSIKVRWQHERRLVEGCILVLASSGEDAVRRANELLSTRIPDGKDIELASMAAKVPDNCFIVCGKEPALPKVISALGASF